MPKPSSIPLQPKSSSPQPSSGRPPKPQPRRFSAAEKLRIVREADACTERGQIEALLRREGLYSSLLSNWRRALRLHGERGLTSHTPGPKSARNEHMDRVVQLERENLKLRQKLERAEAVIELQKKVSTLLGIELRSDGL